MRNARLALLLTVLLLSGCEQKKEAPEDRMRQLSVELDARNFGRAVELSERLLADAPGNANAYFLRAQALSMYGDIDAALLALESAFKAGFKDAHALDTNPNLGPLRGAPRFQSLIEQYGPSPAAKTVVADKEISAGDVSIKEVDGQQVIKAGDIHITLPKD